MELKFIFFTLLIAGSNGSITVSRMKDISSCVEMKCASFVRTTTTTPDPCADCRNAPLIITDTSVTQNVPLGEGAACYCQQIGGPCYPGFIIDRPTCKSDGSIDDCVCINSDPCAECRNQPIIITDNSATQDVPSEGEPCICKKNSVACDAGDIIDRSTCTFNGHFSDCRCINSDPCAKCRNAPVIITDTTAIQDVPVGEDENCKCEQIVILCPPDYNIDTSTCKSNGSVFVCYCYTTLENW